MDKVLCGAKVLQQISRHPMWRNYKVCFLSVLQMEPTYIHIHVDTYVALHHVESIMLVALGPDCNIPTCSSSCTTHMTFRCRQAVLFKLFIWGGGVMRSDLFSITCFLSFIICAIAFPAEKAKKNNESKVFGESSTPESNIMQCTA